MKDKPDRPPDISTPLALPTDETLRRLEDISETNADDDVRFLAAVVAQLAASVETIAKALPGIARGDFVSLDPDVEE